MLVQVASVTTVGSACVYSPPNQCPHLAGRIRPNPLAGFSKAALCAGPGSPALRVSVCPSIRCTVFVPTVHAPSHLLHTTTVPPEVTRSIDSN